MTFLERVENFLFTTASELIHTLLHLKSQDEIMRKYFGEDLPPIEDIVKNTSLVLINHHYSLAFPRPLLPNMVEIGGYHINPPKPLPSVSLNKIKNHRVIRVFGLITLVKKS